MAQSDRDLRNEMERAMRNKVRAPFLLAFKRLTLEAFSRVVQRSPVDTGRFRGNWQVGVGTRPTSHDTAVTDFAPQGSPPNMAKALEEVSKVTMETDATYVVNNLPYAERLENGHSKQAPAGMVEVTAQELRVAAREILKQTGGV